MYIVRHLTHRVGGDKTIKKLFFYDQETALLYIQQLRDFETILLFKKDERKTERRKILELDKNKRV